MQHYATFDANGLNPAFYNDDIYPPQADGSRNAAIPAAAVEITDAQWAELQANQGLRQYKGGEIVAYAPPAPPAATPLVTGRQIVAQVKVAGIGSALLTFLSAAATVQAMPTSVSYWNAIALNTSVPIDDPKVANILAGAGVKDVPAFMAAAVLLPV